MRNKLNRAIKEFVRANNRKPTHIAISSHDYMQLCSEIHMPGIKQVFLDEFRKNGSYFAGIPLIWKEGVLV